VEFFQEKCHAEWLTELRAMDTSTMSYPDVLTKILFMRLVKLAPYVSSWPQAIAILAFPSNLPGAVATLARTSDVACVQAGDGNVDASWFSKRIAVGGLYVGAEFYMLTDYSEDFKDTEDFIRRQIIDMQNAGSSAHFAIKQVETLLYQALENIQSHKNANRP